jgi:polysaccharide biosynthesis/export protein
MFKKSTLSLVSLVLLILIVSSCTRYRDLVYLQAPREKQPEVFTAKPPEYKIQQRDILYIRILSLNQEVTQVMNNYESSNSNLLTNEASLYIYGYNVNDSGYIEIPVIGKVNVLNKTIDEAKKAISEQTAIYLKDATVIIKLISFKFTVLGEVLRPGAYYNYNNQLTVLEALSSAGDITSYGNKHKIMVIRPGNNGTKTFRLDLTKTDILSSDGFFLLPNDIVYVEPVRSYNFKVNIPTIGVFLSAVTTLILVLNYIKYH